MKRTGWVVLMILGFCSSYAQINSTGTMAVARTKSIEKAGGMIRAPASGSYIVVLNNQKRISAETLRNVSDEIEKVLSFCVSLETKSSLAPIKDAVNRLSDTNAAVVVIIADMPDQPSLLIAPENRWALVNVAALSVDGPGDKLLTERVTKEIWRAVAYVLGAADSLSDICVMKSVHNVRDLDQLKTQICCPEPMNKIFLTASKLKLSPIRNATYRIACMQGWAPMPTNEIQKAIWEEVKAKKAAGK